MKVKVDSILLFVQNIDNLKAFYVTLLGLEVVEEIPTTWLLLNAGTCTIGLHKIGAAYRDENQEEFKFDNNTKIVFEVEGDLSAYRENLLSNNIKLGEIMSWDTYPYWVCDGEDPEGNIFQLKAKK